MFKKINQYMLENHPLVWNTRLIWMVLILFGFNLVFFFLGIFSYQSPIELHEYNIFNRYFLSVYVWFGILLAILILILWMNHYFKQNAFKSHYPKSNFCLYKEFWIIFFITAFVSSSYFSFTKGLQIRIAGIKTEEQLQKDIDLINRAAPFTLQTFNNSTYSEGNPYSQINRCLSLPLFDSLVDKDQLLKKYVANQIKSFRNWENEDSMNYQQYADSLNNLINTHPEYEELLMEKFPHRKNWQEPNDYKTFEEVRHNEFDVAYDEVPYILEAATEANYTTGGNNQVVYRSNLNSIYNYCGVLIYPADSTKNDEYYAKKTHQLLANNQKDSIQKLMTDYLKLADEFKVAYRFKDKNWIDYVYNPPYYFVDYELNSSSRFSEFHKKTFKKDHIGQEDLESVINNIQMAHTGVIAGHEYITWLYLALGFALLIFTFRTTSMRAWVISVVGSIVLVFIFFSIFFVVSYAFFESTEFLAFLIFLGFIILFWFFALSGILSGKRKLISGVNLNWGIWTFGAILPILIFLYTEYLDYFYPPKTTYLPNGGYEYKQHPHIEWLNDHYLEIGYGNIVLILIFIFLIIPILKKWQAMADE